MPEFFGLAPAGLGWLIAAAFLGGLVRGFSGFGTAMVFLPVAAPILGPFGAILALTIMDLFGPLPNLRRAWGSVEKPDLWRLLAGCALALPVGLWVLTRVEPEVFRYAVSLVSLGMVAVLLLGLRYRGAVRRTMVAGIGAAAGLLGGVAGIPGPVVILFYMSRPLPVAVIRATILLFLFFFDILIVGYMTGMGRVSLAGAALGLALALPNVAGNWVGGGLFRPDQERLYRAAAYLLIAVAALSGLPVWE
ncbi:TSUP family transporter [Antarctobacter sp.]|uniref:TSUP family transporter n=1 Tax=Antarctobacter sp. TaxID=1872577 RepID=UPI003A8FD971